MKKTICMIWMSAVCAYAEKPNIVFILADDMGWTGLSSPIDNRLRSSCSDFYLTPNLDALAEDGVRYSDAYAPSAMCTPSRASFLTGRSPAALGMTCPGPVQTAQPYRKLVPPSHIQHLPAGEVTIAEALKTARYRTAHFGKWHVGGGGPGGHGFDVHDGNTGNEGPGLYADPNPKDIFGMTERAIEFMKTTDGPFYLQLSHYALHTPAEALKETLAEVTRRTPGEYHNDTALAAMTQDLDRSIGLLRKSIRDLGLSDRTYIVFTSDNGAAGRLQSKENLPLAGGKASLWEGGIRVPLIVAGPGIRTGHDHRSVIGYDLYATFCQWAGVKIPAKVEGIPLDRVADGRELVFHFPHYGQGPRQTPMSSIRSGHWKLLRNYENDTVMLFDLEKDIGETTDLAENEASMKTRLEHRLNEVLAKLGAKLPRPNPGYRSDARRPEGTVKERGSPFISRLDKNGDGNVSRAEFTGPARRFGTLDTNGDGTITADEAPSGPPERKR